jgi:protein translocase SecG subunit
MVTLVFIIMVLSGIIFILSVLLMAPKGGLGFGVGGMATSNEYGSKKSLEGTLKKSAFISIVIFTICALIYPYLNKAALSTGRAISVPSETKQSIKLKPQDIKIE